MITKIKKRHLISLSFIICHLSFSVALTSCSDYLEVMPSDQQTADQLFGSKAGFYTAANGIYNDLASDALYGKNLTWGAVDLMAQSYSNTSLALDYKALATENYTDTYAAPVLAEIWGTAYEDIMAANLLIEQIDKQNGQLTPLEADVLKGEMLAVRAMLHLDMLRLFGPSPLLGLDQKAIPYNESTQVTVHDLITIKEAGEKIIRDLDQAEQLLQKDPIIAEGPLMSQPEGDESVQLRYRQYRLNYYAAIALKARTYAYVLDTEKGYAEATRLINDETAQKHFPAIDPNQLLANTSNPDRVYSSEVFFGVYDKDRDRVFDNFFASTAPLSQRLQPYAGYIGGQYGLFGHLILGVETYDYRFQSQWEQAAGVGATGHQFIKYKAIAKPDPTDEDSEYYFAKMIPLISMQEMYYIACECATTDDERATWYNLARVRRGCPDLAAIGYLPLIASYWGIGYGPIFLSNEVRRETWGTGQWLYFAKHYNIGEALGLEPVGAYYYFDCGAAQTYGNLAAQPPLPVEEMK